MSFQPQPPEKRLTHRGVDIATLRKPAEVSREIVQELVEAGVFVSLAWMMAADTSAGEASAVALLTGIVLMTFCADRLAVVCELIVRFNEIDADED